MEHLKQIIKIIQAKKLAQIDITDDSLSHKEDTLFNKYYEILSEGKIIVEDDVIVELYGKINASTKQNYRKLKSRLSKKIFNILLYQDLNSVDAKNTYQKIVFEQRRLVQITNILEKNNARGAIVKIIKDNYYIAEQFYLYDVLKHYCYQMCLYHSLKVSKSDYLFYSRKFQEFSEKETLVQKNTLSYYYIQMLMQSKIKDTDSKMDELEKAIKQMAEIREQVFSFETEYYYLRSLFYYYENINGTQGMLDTSNEIELLVTQNNFKNQIWQGIAALHRAKALFSLKKYHDGFHQMTIDSKLFGEGGQNWLIAKEFEFRFAMALHDIASAEKILDEAMKHRDFKNKQPVFKERWYIHKVYFQLMKESFGMEPKKSKLKINKLINDTPFYLNDKSGFYISIKILEIVDEIRFGKYDNFEENISALKKYKSRYLKSNTLEREKTFINMILSLEKHGFNYRKAQLANAKNEKSLRLNEAEYLSNEFEILPYEDLWEIILRGLKSAQ